VLKLALIIGIVVLVFWVVSKVLSPKKQNESY
jgi:flagellar biogenesis protein FliO